MRTFGDCFALFDDATWPHRPARLLTEPTRLIEAFDATGVETAFDAIAEGAASGLVAAGYCAYELGYVFEARLSPLMPKTGQPLLRFVLFARSETLAPNTRDEFLSADTPRLSAIVPSLDERSYGARIGDIRKLIADGDVYQVNFTLKLNATLTGGALGLYARLRESSRAGAASFLRFPDEDIVSLSPERFFAVANGRITARPMKGTCPRAPDWRGDATRKLDLKRDPKQRAENLMIVDLLRNDISRVAKIGSVRVDDLFTVETYPRFHTMTSGISADLNEGVCLREIVRALFPCGSVTGAPKIRAMEIIRALEDEPRGVYCGAVGYVDKQRAAFSVAIRTLSVRGNKVQMGVGGGIVWDSEPDSEYAECLLKARFLTETAPPFHLIETLRWSPREGFFLFRRHLSRLARSARYFGFAFDQRLVRDRLVAAVAQEKGPQRVRLTLDARGDAQVTVASFAPHEPDVVWRFAISERRTDSRQAIYHHKTSSRDVYDSESQRLHDALGADEVVFLNERGEVTEGSRSTIFVERDGRWLTPPLECGVLDGCLRRELIEAGNPVVEERVLMIDDLASGQVWFGNALRGLIPGLSIPARSETVIQVKHGQIDAAASAETGFR
jgi:para-aminobenzoate synthetase/4-amino-4-deoxychorismate lyase